jgi:hypothetical protein
MRYYLATARKNIWPLQHNPMATNRQLKIDLLKVQSEYARMVEKVLNTLTVVDPDARVAPVERAVASRALVKRLWELLPDEHEACQFERDEDLMRLGKACLPSFNYQQPVVLHLGWDILCFTCSLEAAWLAWPEFKSLSQDTFNSCIYPTNLEWYTIRAGTNLYPMVFENGQYRLKTAPAGAAPAVARTL